MKPVRSTVLASLAGGALLAMAATSHAAFNGRSFNHSALANNIRSDRNEIQQEREKLGDNRRDLNQDREQLRDDRRDGASRPEIANDRSDIRQDRQDIARDHHDLQVERRDLRHDLQQERHSFSTGGIRSGVADKLIYQNPIQAGFLSRKPAWNDFKHLSTS